MRIAQVSPLYESVPPKCYGGTERVVSYLTEELTRMGHDVTLFAAGDSITAAELVPCVPRGLRLDPGVIDPIAHHILMIERVVQRAQEFDVIHYHCDYMHFPVSRRSDAPSLTTLHGRLDLPDLVPIYREYHDMPLVSISDSQRAPLPWVNWLGTVHHGLPEDAYAFQPRPNPRGYLAFLGRISPEKRVDRAIEIATRVGIPLKIAAKVDRADQEYFERDIEALLDNPLVEYIGEIGEAEKGDFLGGARALLFPIDWPEPFGLVMIESLACGTPVVAFRHGSVPEVIDDGVTGYVVDDMDSAVAATARAVELDRRAIRARFDARFSARCMAEAYLEVYSRLARVSETGRRAAHSVVAA